MLAKVHTCAVVGLEGALVQVEVDVAGGLQAFTTVGLPDAAVQEAKERVRAAIKNSGLRVPPGRITVNLAPADLRKVGPAYDLPIAIGVLSASRQLPPPEPGNLFLGELSLDGSLRHTTGVLPMVSIAAEHGIERVFLPAEDAHEAGIVPDIEIIPVETLAQLVDHLNGVAPIAPHQRRPLPDAPEDEVGLDMAHIRGQEHAKRALEVAAAGGHNILLSGPPGVGKTLLARTLPTILPALSAREALDVTKIYSVAGLLSTQAPMVRRRPFRSPHHTISYAGLIGGGKTPRPGEVSLAHRGVLFLDELPEFGQAALELLRQPLEVGVVTISRAQGATTYPAKFMLVGAMNPCPCGYHGDPVRECTCSPGTVARYQKRLSGPLLDRVDIHLEVGRVEHEKLAGTQTGEPSAAIRARVEAARERQQRRFAGTALTTNAEMGPAEVRRHCTLDSAGQALMRAAMQQLQLSARAFHRTLKLARTIADLAGADAIAPAHLAEAIQYRQRARA